LYRIPYEPDAEELEQGKLELVAKIPGGGGHSSRSLKVGPEGRLYVSLGISGNCSDEYLHDSYPEDDRRGGVMVLDESSQPAQWQTWASGLRNPIGFDWHPGTKVMYASNNGPDHLGYDQPPESFARLTPGSFHGMPWYQYDGNKIHRDHCINSEPPRTNVSKPVATFPARNAPMDVHFIDDGYLAKQFYGDAIVALHGSWGTQPYGRADGQPSSRRPPKLVLVRFEHGKAVRVDDLLNGFQNQKGDRLARPMGLGTGPDGALYMTSDGGINGLFRLIRTESN
jgi:glucose/arabinose dehydrogenase